jgi:hypothetical protein
MDIEQERRLLRSVGGGHAGKRNTGNLLPDETAIAGQLVTKQLLKTTTHKGSEWLELTNSGQARLYFLNGLELGV